MLGIITIHPTDNGEAVPQEEKPHINTDENEIENEGKDPDASKKAWETTSPHTNGSSQPQDKAPLPNGIKSEKTRSSRSKTTRLFSDWEVSLSTGNSSFESLPHSATGNLNVLYSSLENADLLDLDPMVAEEIATNGRPEADDPSHVGSSTNETRVNGQVDEHSNDRVKSREDVQLVRTLLSVH